MAANQQRYRFHVHKALPYWRLVLVAGAAQPAGMNNDEWEFTRERDGVDTNDNVKVLCEKQGYCLFKMAGTFEDVAREVSAHGVIPPMAGTLMSKDHD
jgi:hypothetical protein